MLALKRAMILGIAVLLIVWAALLSIGQVVGASEALPPTLVSPLNNSWVTENKPTFKWSTPGNNQSGFNLQINATTGLVQNITSKSNTQNYTLTTALSDGMYYWRVKTNDTSGVWSDWSAVWFVKVDTTPPNSVVNVFLSRKWTEFKVKEMAIGGGEFVEINWTASDDPYFKQYEIYISKALPPMLPDTIPNATITDAYSTTYTTEEPLDSDTTYYISVVVVDQAGLSSEAATPVSVTTSAPMNWPLMGGIALAVEVAIGAIFVVFKLFIKKK